jgi:hypothetical protein
MARRFWRWPGRASTVRCTEVCRQAIRETESVSPRLAETAFYGRAHRVYRALYPALKSYVDFRASRGTVTLEPIAA